MIVGNFPHCQGKAGTFSVAGAQTDLSCAPSEGMHSGNTWSPKQCDGSCHHPCGKTLSWSAAGPLCTILIAELWGLLGWGARERTAEADITPCSRHVLPCHGHTDGPHLALPLKSPLSPCLPCPCRGRKGLALRIHVTKEPN